MLCFYAAQVTGILLHRLESDFFCLQVDGKVRFLVLSFFLGDDVAASSTMYTTTVHPDLHYQHCAITACFFKYYSYCAIQTLFTYVLTSLPTSRQS